MLRILENESTTSKELFALAKAFFNNKDIYLLLDDSLIAKIYAKNIEGLTHIFDPSNQEHYKALCSVVAMITDGEYAIPVNHNFWIP